MHHERFAMRMNLSRRRSGAALLEYAIVAPFVFFVILALVVGGMAVFRYQEVSYLAREATRYASTHGGHYFLDGNPTTTGVAAVTSDSDVETYVQAKAVNMDPAKLTATVSWSSPSTISPRNIPYYVNTDPNLVPPGQTVIQNYVTVTVTYEWVPELILVGPINLTSTSTVAMSY
jgi:Flp pilus assembly protein TadG